jgi:hypothetical protein
MTDAYDSPNGALAFSVHPVPVGSFDERYSARFLVAQGTFDVEVETFADGTAAVTLTGLHGRTYRLLGLIPLCGVLGLEIGLVWTPDYVLLRFNGHEVSRIAVTGPTSS